MKPHIVSLLQLKTRHSTGKKKKMQCWDFLGPYNLKSLWFLSKDLIPQQDNIHRYSVILQWNTDITARSRDKAATCQKALLPSAAYWSTDYSWSPPDLATTGDHRGKHHPGESCTSYKSTVIATGTEAALRWCLEAFNVSSLTTKTKQCCPKRPPQKCAACQIPHHFARSGNHASMCHLQWKSQPHKGYNLADSLDISG